jgi:hypothetical protein
MARRRDQIDLRDPGFLLWLGEFLGEWKLEGEVQVQVRRREDGFLRTLSLDGNVPLGSVLRRGELVERPESPLGPYPVALSEALMSLWLAPERCLRLRGAGRVGAGQRIMLKALEESIAQTPQPQRDRRWLAWWTAGAASLPPLSDRDSATHRMLYRRYRRLL